jgi:hypothetical protein
VNDFASSTDRLLHQVRHWEQPRWSANGRADRVYALAQHLADLTADAEARPHRPLPREHDLVLPDQIRVLADDLMATDNPDKLAEATAAIDAVRKQL